ncbi:major facilitator superfamily domain-containing protein [Poronia punctata]|nr:major facilitator superfamily domain-containing protein [Poronia punctata]
MASDLPLVSDEKTPELVHTAEIPGQRQSGTSSETIVVSADDDVTNLSTECPQGDSQVPPPLFSTYTKGQKQLIVISAAFSGLFASWTAQIYLPALNDAANDLDVTVKKINLTVTSYMLFQGITPIFVSSYADVMGRRPVYIICFIVYIATDIGLALTDSYGSLLGLRAVQSIAISSTQALCQGVVADISTSAERGQYSFWLALPTILGPSIGPVIGGIISQYLGWRRIFWFLAIAGGVNLAILVSFFPETCRNIVGDGSALPRKANRTLLQLFRFRSRKDHGDIPSAERDTEVGTTPTQTMNSPKTNFPRAKFISALTLLLEKEIFVVSVYGSLLFAGLFAIGTAGPSLFFKYYGFSGLQIGLLYLPLAAGGVLSVVVAKAQDWNFRRHARRLGVPVDSARETDLSRFPIERVRVEVLVPPFLLSVIVMAAWGWAIDSRVSVGVLVVLIFLLGLGIAGVSNVVTALITDIRPGKAAAAAASNNIVKFVLGAAMTAAIEPLISAVGPGKAFSILATFYVIFSPCLVLVVKKGMKWREEVRDKDRRASEAC